MHKREAGGNPNSLVPAGPRNLEQIPESDASNARAFELSSLFDAGGLAEALAQVVEPCATDAAVAQHFDVVKLR